MKDKLFLLSKEEFEKYKDRIPLEAGSWWLRSPCKNDDGFHVDIIDQYNGSFLNGRGHIGRFQYGIRPAFYLDADSEILKSGKDIFTMGKYNERLVKWIVLDQDTGLCISKYILCENRFDDDSNDYETSEVRSLLGKLEKEIFHDADRLPERKEDNFDFQELSEYAEEMQKEIDKAEKKYSESTEKMNMLLTQRESDVRDFIGKCMALMSENNVPQIDVSVKDFLLLFRRNQETGLYTTEISRVCHGTICLVGGTGNAGPRNADEQRRFLWNWSDNKKKVFDTFALQFKRYMEAKRQNAEKRALDANRECEEIGLD